MKYWKTRRPGEILKLKPNCPCHSRIYTLNSKKPSQIKRVSQSIDIGIIKKNYQLPQQNPTSDEAVSTRYQSIQPRRWHQSREDNSLRYIGRSHFELPHLSSSTPIMFKKKEGLPFTRDMDGCEGEWQAFIRAKKQIRQIYSHEYRQIRKDLASVHKIKDRMNLIRKIEKDRILLKSLLEYGDDED